MLQRLSKRARPETANPIEKQPGSAKLIKQRGASAKRSNLLQLTRAQTAAAALPNCVRLVMHTLA
jgi:hypothetical protein